MSFPFFPHLFQFSHLSLTSFPIFPIFPLTFDMHYRETCQAWEEGCLLVKEVDPALAFVTSGL